MNHRPTTLLAALITLIASTAGCLWYRPVAVEVDPITIDRPDPNGRSTPDPNSPRDQPDAPVVVVRDVDVGALPRPTAAAWTPIEPTIGLLPGGLRAATAQWPDSEAAHLSVTIAHREVAARRIGLASLTAAMLADAPLEQGSRPALRRMVETAGGDLRIDVDATSTRFSCTVATRNWRRVVETMAMAIGEVPTSGGRLEEARAILVRRLGERWSDDPLAAAVERVRSIEFEGLPGWLGALEDSRLEDVVTFHRDVYRPESAVVAVVVPDIDAARALEFVKRSFSTWTASSNAQAPFVQAFTPPSAGVYWSDGQEPAQIAVITELMPAATTGAAAQRLVANCLIGSAVEGRVPRYLLDALPDLRLHHRLVDEGPRRRVELTGEIPADRIGDAQRAIDAAVASLGRRPPDPAELAAAAARARLRLMLDLRDPRDWAAEVARSVFAGAMPNRILQTGQDPVEVPGTDPLTATAAALADPGAIDLTAQLATVTQHGGLLVALGVDLSATPTFARMPDSRIPIERRTVATADREQQERQATELLDLAARAAGGAPPLLGLGGFHTVSVTRTGRGPEAVDHVWFLLDGRYRRMRHVLASTVETVIGPDGGMESCDGKDAKLSERDSQAALDAARRHPLVLLSDWLRGTARYRQISQREVHGRPLAVLERTDGDSGRIRIYVDVDSGLIRAVVTREDRENGAVWLREEWRDYRAAGRGLRAPHHCTTWIDDGPQGFVTTFAQIDAVAPDPSWLQLGGPVR